MNGPVRVALVADTHGVLDPRVAAVAHGCDRILHAGDVGCAAVLDELGAAGAPVEAVLGNNDTARHWPQADRDRLDALPEQIEVALPGGSLVLVHGHRLPARVRHERLRRRHADAAAVVIGHSHRRVVDRAAIPWMLNPGAAGRSRAYGGPGCLVLEADESGWSIETHAFEPPRRRR